VQFVGCGFRVSCGKIVSQNKQRKDVPVNTDGDINVQGEVDKDVNLPVNLII